MKNTSNINTINALIRITCGLTMLSYLTAKMVRRPWKQSYIFLAMLAAMKVAEGILRYCPLTELFNKSQHMYQDMLSDLGNFTFDNPSFLSKDSSTDSTSKTED